MNPPAYGDHALPHTHSEGADPNEPLLARFEEAIEDLRFINDHLACDAASREAGAIAYDLGLRHRKSLTAMDLADLTDAVDTNGVAANDLRSFHRADLVVEATDRQGDICYVAAEASRTVDSRDVARAIRNARLLTRFTGRRSYAVVTGWGRDDRVRRSVEAGEVSWCELAPY